MWKEYKQTVYGISSTDLVQNNNFRQFVMQIILIVLFSKNVQLKECLIYFKYTKSKVAWSFLSFTCLISDH